MGWNCRNGISRMKRYSLSSLESIHLLLSQSVYLKSTSQAINVPLMLWAVVWVSAACPRKLRDFKLFFNGNSTRNHSAYRRYSGF